MDTRNMIPLDLFCVHHKAEYSFIESLQDYGLVEITTIERQTFLNESQLPELEKFVRLHYDLNINLEGIEAIGHLLEKIKEMQDQNTRLRNRLNLYEEKS